MSLLIAWCSGDRRLASITGEDAQRYLDAVAVALVDTPEATRTELLEDLALHLAEFAASPPTSLSTTSVLPNSPP